MVGNVTEACAWEITNRLCLPELVVEVAVEPKLMPLAPCKPAVPNAGVEVPNVGAALAPNPGVVVAPVMKNLYYLLTVIQLTASMA